MKIGLVKEGLGDNPHTALRHQRPLEGGNTAAKTSLALRLAGR